MDALLMVALASVDEAEEMREAAFANKRYPYVSHKRRREEEKMVVDGGANEEEEADGVFSSSREVVAEERGRRGPSRSFFAAEGIRDRERRDRDGERAEKRKDLLRYEASATTVKDLKQRCRLAGLAVSGTKTELASRLANVSRGQSTDEAHTIRMKKAPLHAGVVRQGSLRVVAAHNDRSEKAALELVAEFPKHERACYRVVPGRLPVAVSVLRHDHVFFANKRHARLNPAPVCPCCHDPAEVYDVSDDAASYTNPLHSYLQDQGLEIPGIPLYLRVCRKGCFSYETTTSHRRPQKLPPSHPEDDDNDVVVISASHTTDEDEYMDDSDDDDNFEGINIQAFHAPA